MIKHYSKYRDNLQRDLNIKRREMMSKKVLVVEDKKFWHNIWRRQLEFVNSGGVILISAFSVKEAEKQFAANPDVAAIVMDACVPGDTPNTSALVQKIRETFKGPMIAISSCEDYQQVILKTGCDHFSSKENLIQKIQEVLDL